MSVGQFTQLATDKIGPSPYQYRKSFGGAEDDELAQSVQKHGVLQPVRVRPHASVPGTFELVFGERRWRAAKAAKLDEVPAIVVDLTDDQVIEQLLVENLSRKDVHPIEEGEGYHKLLHEYGYTIDQLVAKTGRSKAHLYGRIKLARELAPGAKKAVLDGRLPTAHAELIARIGDPKLQEQCTRIVLGKLDHKDDDELADDLQALGIEHERVSPDGKYAQQDDAQPLSFRATQALIRQKFTTALSLAKFDVNDPLLTKAGACTGCQYRSSNQPGLPGLSDAKKDDICLKPSCFTEKSEATWKKVAAAAAETGLEVLDKDDAKRVFAYDGVSIAGDSPYVPVTEELPYDLQKTPGSKATWNKLLGKLAGDVKRVLVQDESGAPRELIDKAAAVKLLREQGKIDKPLAKKSSGAGNDYEKQRERDKAKRELNHAAMLRVLEQVAAGAAKLPGEKDLPSWRWLAYAAIGQFGNDIVSERRGLKKGEDVLFLVEKAKTLGELRSLVVECLVADMSERGLGSYPNKHDKVAFEAGVKLYGGNWDKAIDAAKEAAKAEKKVDATKKAKKGAAKK